MENLVRVWTAEELDDKTARQLYDICKALKIKNYTSFKKDDLINEIVQVSRGEKVIVRKKRGRKSKAELEAIRKAQQDEQTKAKAQDAPKLFEQQAKPEPQEIKPERPERNVQQAEQVQQSYTQPSYEQHPRQEQRGEPIGQGYGVLEIHPDGYGFLRTSFVPNPKDVYLAPSQIRRFGLRNGDYVEGTVRFPTKPGEKYAAMLKVDTVNGVDPEISRNRPHFESLVPIFPDEKLRLELRGVNDITLRLIELSAPIGKGQRGMIVSPPKVGKTTIIKKIAKAISVNHPEVTLMILLVDERPEEVTDMQRSVKAQVISSTFDQLPENHIRVVELAIERAKRLVEMRKDVVVLMDGITRLTRAYNLVMSPTGRTLTGGLDTSAIHGPKKILGAARNIDGGGSLTIIATCLVETGSKMDEVIYEEFKGTGNMELVLDRKLAERGLFPAIEIKRSGTRRDELLYNEEERKRVWSLKRFLSNLESFEALEKLIKWLTDTHNNEQFLRNIVPDDERKR